MRYLILLLSVTLVQCVYQQTPFNSVQEQQQLEEELYHAFTSFLDPQDPDDAEKNCDSCLSMLRMTKRFCYFPERIQLAAMTNICKRSKQVDNQVCEGIVREQGPVIRNVLRTMDISGRDGHLACASVLNSCPYPDVIPWDVPFPKPKPRYPYTKKPSYRSMNVLHLSDWHVDPEYEEGTETQCSKPICCRKSSTGDSVLISASKWGAYECDSPLTLIESMLEYIPKAVPNITFGILTGDIPPHEVWSTLPISKTQMIQDASYALLHAHFDSPFFINSRLYPAIGNHESAPTNLFPLKESHLPGGKSRQDFAMHWLYLAMQENWKGWIDKVHLPSVHGNSGSYISYPVSGLKLISMNTNFCYNLNWWLHQSPVQRDPNGILAWLIGHLQQSEDAREKVWIIGHTPPGDSACFHDYSNYFYQIVNRYAPHVIAAQFYGHTHRDEFQLFYKGDSQEAEDAISVAYIAPSITPYPDLNPGFRSYSVDTGSFEVIDSHTFIADLNRSILWDLELNWHKEYSAKDLYETFDNEYQPLSPSWWHRVTQYMELDDKLFDKFWINRYKQSPFTPVCDKDCKVNTICTMRAGKSEYRCDYVPELPTGRPVILNSKEEEACGIQLIKKNYPN
ncbi:Metallo-dependent phosphatase-like protein [Mucor mucedo]|uniref:Metallo-dependent phosphatase-like protein n=1 Tax=Mucor mucedo TaxID=29922 RepID=UPI00221EB9CE|nr:Metallo-dependent phosphatase-like protein [Mucor mucedo]KAI7877878.1 Metallo-dependent phosphatase-like protein [Mucor mucedo]